ncbi:MAG: monothiol glutaredoxin grx4 [Piccolia ochrophora]|nr:MAG: monothiol glutaredoxin grx4 [Piccolia ochrophora]
MTSITDITTPSDFQSHLTSHPDGTVHVLNFHAPWAAPCWQMRTILSTLASSYPPSDPASITFASINAEDLPDISEEYDVTAVPYLILIRSGKVLDTLGGSDATKVRELVERHAGKPGAPSQQNGAGKSTLPPAQKADDPAPTTSTNLSAYAPSSSDPSTAPEMTSTLHTGSSTSDPAASNPQAEEQQDLHSRLTSLVRAAPVMLFMKGTPSVPQCGFSRQLVALLRGKGVRYGFFNILADEDVRQGLKTFADWPTFPQLWVDGDLVGGLDIVKEEWENDPEFLGQYAVKANGGGPGSADAKTQAATAST